MGAIDWTEKCRDEMPAEAGYLDRPFESGDTWANFLEADEDDDQDDDAEDQFCAAAE
jgi:hypothetical protein